MAFDGFAFGLFLWFAIFVVLYGTTVGYLEPTNGVTTSWNLYKLFSNINVMAFVGFGTLMSSNAKLGMTATAMSLVYGAVAALWYMLNHGLWDQAMGPVRPLPTVRLGQDSLVRADFAVTSMLVAVGAVIGRITPLQGLILVIIHILFYSVNESLGAQRLKINDVGGSMTIHMFGAIFGVFASAILDRSASRREIPSDDVTTTTSNVRSLIGTLFLFVNWPSFNCYFAAASTATYSAVLAPSCVVNTYLALFMSALMALTLSRLFSCNKMMVADLQNSVLAGAVAIGATSNIFVTPFGALIIGACGACISVVGIRYINPYLRRAIGLRDTFYVLSLHGLPGMFGGFVAIIAAASAVLVEYTLPYEAYPATAELYTQAETAALQLAYLLLSFGMAAVGGVIAGLLMRLAPNPTRFGTDSDQWVLADSQFEPIME